MTETITQLICNKCGGVYPEALFSVCHSKEPLSPNPIGVCDNCLGLTAVEVEAPPEEEIEPVEEPAEDPVEEPAEE